MKCQICWENQADRDFGDLQLAGGFRLETTPGRTGEQPRRGIGGAKSQHGQKFYNPPQGCGKSPGIFHHFPKL